MKVSKEKIKSFIPQREPFIMIDNLIEVTKEKFETDFIILPNNIFLEDNLLQEFALIENIAQSSAAGLYFLNMSSGSKPVDGFIGAVSKLKLYDLPKVNDKINTIVTPLHQFGNMYLVKGENFLNGKLLLECEMKLAGI